jgi:hypothetical protein
MLNVVRKKGFGMVVVVLAGCAVLISAIPAAPQEIDDRSGLRMYIRMDRFIFNEDDNINLDIVVKNTLFKKDSFKIYDKVYTTFQPVVYTSDGREADIAVPHRLMNRDIKDVVASTVPRVIELAPSETITRRIDLKKLYNLKEGGEYRVKVYFFPDVLEEGIVPSENTLRFKITRSEQYYADGRSGIQEIRSGIDHGRFSVSPREVVLLFLNAEKEQDWRCYFKFMKIENYINAFPNYGKLYNNSDDVEKLKIVERFVNFLKSERADYLIDFQVKKQSIVKGKDIAYVNARVKRFNPRFRPSYNYIFTLEKFRSNWLITHVEATVRKGD